MPLVTVAPYPELRAFPASVISVGQNGLPFTGMTALLVEDSRFASEILRLMWRRAGGRLRRAESLAQARMHCRTYRPELVIVDLGLPDGRGEDLIRELAQSAQPPLILGLSGDPDGRGTAMAAGAKAFIEKPLGNLDALHDLLAQFLPIKVSREVEARHDTQPRPQAMPDPLCLQDDLRHAAVRLASPVEGAERRYLSAYLMGLARSSKDQALLLQAEAFAKPQTSAAPLLALIETRLRGAEGF